MASTLPFVETLTNAIDVCGAWWVQSDSLPSDCMRLSSWVSKDGFAVFGHDSAAAGQENTNDVPIGMLWRLQRTWQVEQVGSFNSEIRFDTTGLANVGDGSTLRVLVDTDSAFTNATPISGHFGSPTFWIDAQPLSQPAWHEHPGQREFDARPLPQLVDGGWNVAPKIGSELECRPVEDPTLRDAVGGRVHHKIHPAGGTASDPDHVAEQRQDGQRQPLWLERE